MGVILYNNPDFQDALSKFGVSAANLVNAKSIKAKELLSNPQQMASIAPAYRRAKAAGAGDTFLAGLGVDPAKFAPYLDSYEPTNAERYDTALGAGGGPEAKAGAEIATDTVAQRTANAALQTGLPEKQAAAASGQADVTTRATNAQLKNGTPEAAVMAATLEDVAKGQNLRTAIDMKTPALQAIAANKQATFDSNNIDYQGELLNYRRDSGVDKFDINEKALKAKLGEQAAGDYMNYYNRLPAGQMKNYAALGLSNPNFLSYLDEQSKLNTDSALRVQGFKLQGAKDLNDLDQKKLENTISVQKSVDEAVKGVATAEKSGDKNQVAAARMTLNNARSYAAKSRLNGMVFPLDVMGAQPHVGALGGTSKTLTDFYIPDVTDNAQKGLGQIGQEVKTSLAQGSPIDQQTVLGWINDPQYKQSLSAKDYADLVSHIPAIFEQAQQLYKVEQHEQETTFGQRFGENPIGASLGAVGQGIGAVIRQGTGTNPTLVP